MATNLNILFLERYVNTQKQLFKKSDKFICEKNLKKKLLYNKINRDFYIKVSKRIKKTEPLSSIYDDEILIKLILYR